jgi:hyperosmotically inducible protein
MRWTVGLSEEAVKVQVENGWVTLRGQVARLSVSHER